MKNDLIILLIGWAMGLLSPLIVDWIKRPVLKKQIKKGLVTELREAKMKLASNAMFVSMKYGTYDRDMLLWMRQHASDVSQLYSNKRYLDILNRLIKLSDEDIEKLAKEYSEISIAQTGIGLSLKKTRLPYLTSKFGDVSIFDSKVQQLLLEINAQVGFMNEEVDNGKHYFQMTFDSNLTCENRERNELNLKDFNIHVGQMAKRTADTVEEVIQKLT